ncbi:MAG: ATP-binding protein [Bacillota bacterium]
MGNLLEVRKLEFDCQPKIIKKCLKKIFTILGAYKINIENLDFRIELALREMLANAIEHGCHNAKNMNISKNELKIIVFLKIKNYKLVLSVKDPGKGFEWEKCNLESELSFEEKGRGLKMINEVVDELEFNKSGNQITIYFFSREKIVKK